MSDMDGIDSKSWPNFVSMVFGQPKIVKLDFVEVVLFWSSSRQHPSLTSIMLTTLIFFGRVLYKLLIISFHILSFWYGMKSLWHSVSPCLGQSRQVLCLMWALFQNCHVALRVPCFSLRDNTYWDSSFIVWIPVLFWIFTSIVFWVVG